MFKAKHIKQGKLLRKGVKKFLHYKRDLIPEEKLEAIEKVAAEFDEALASKDKAEIESVAKRLTGTCEKAVPAASNPGIRENLEVIFVAVVIAVGIRAYVLQPFKIPTGSMQPTLNGIVAYPQSEAEHAAQKPGLPGRIWETAFAGRKYVDEVLEEDGELVAVTSGTKFKFFPYTTLHFRGGKKKTIKLPLATLKSAAGATGTGFGLDFQFEYEAIQRSTGRPATQAEKANPAVVPVRYKKGKVLARGYVDTGDQVLVDKISYHFRQPKRGEVFVFSTKGTGVQGVPEAQGSQHYIKRLVGVPDDRLEVHDGQLFVNGERASELGMVKVMDQYPKSHPNTHNGYVGVHSFDLTGKREYVAMGDNSANSADSRSWGTVPEISVVGPAFVVYWPFAHHWGRIR